MNIAPVRVQRLHIKTRYIKIGSLTKMKTFFLMHEPILMVTFIKIIIDGITF